MVVFSFLCDPDTTRNLRYQAPRLWGSAPSAYTRYGVFTTFLDYPARISRQSDTCLVLKKSLALAIWGLAIAGRTRETFVATLISSKPKDLALKEPLVTK